MKKVSTTILRITLIGISLGVLALCVLVFPRFWNEIAGDYPSYAYAVYVVFVALYIAAIPFFVGIFKAWQLLSHIDQGRAFSNESARTVRVIAWCAAAISAVYVASLPFFYIWADADDAPGLVLIGMVLASAPFIIAVFAALLQKLIAEASELKSENELTV